MHINFVINSIQGTCCTETEGKGVSNTWENNPQHQCQRVNLRVILEDHKSYKITPIIFKLSLFFQTLTTFTLLLESNKFNNPDHVTGTHCVFFFLIWIFQKKNLPILSSCPFGRNFWASTTTVALQLTLRGSFWSVRGSVIALNFEWGFQNTNLIQFSRRIWATQQIAIHFPLHRGRTNRWRSPLYCKIAAKNSFIK